jgi:enamine deaminase RidA (YjgF/YER057c/UK114 family)
MGPAHPENLDTAAREEQERERLRDKLRRRNDRKAEMLDSKGKPLKPARSQAEVQALHQRNIQIALTATNVLIASLTCLKVFGIL